MSHFTKLDNKVVNDQLKITADVAEEGTGEGNDVGGFPQESVTAAFSHRSETLAAEGSPHLLPGRNAVLPEHTHSLQKRVDREGKGEHAHASDHRGASPRLTCCCVPDRSKLRTTTTHPSPTHLCTCLWGKFGRQRG